MKSCNVCEEEFPLDNFYPDPSKKDGCHGTCKPCTKARRKAYYAANKEDIRVRQRAYYGEHRDDWLATARKLRTDALAAYGPECKCCGETTVEFLAIDHVNNDGEEHRRELAGCGRSIYQWLKKNGYPQDGRFQVLCHNCNMAKGLYGLCPHQGTPPYIRAKHLNRKTAA